MYINKFVLVNIIGFFKEISYVKQISSARNTLGSVLIRASIYEFPSGL